MSAEIFEKTGERFVEPQVTPPETSDQVTEPFMSELVRHNRSDVDFVEHVSVLRVVQEVGFSVINITIINRRIKLILV